MKISIVLLAALIAVIQAENCFEVADCNHLTCADGTIMQCVLPTNSTTNVCTCTGTPISECTVQADCQRNACSSLRDPHEHCIDGHCRCLFFQPGK
ncbi:hypothetical protein CHS0354_035607 [Potamilus streckersoni]|uniref:Uncharacterized protein n=1 Tax=Potamilus streckersoni TaxID=2493646 RepID=A0AAE0RRV2_9BIVA|nr:hypothetical protein CHS0354_035607 [Potamilus streckersoni]